jgi:hypothetical protein
MDDEAGSKRYVAAGLVKDFSKGLKFSAEKVKPNDKIINTCSHLLGWNTVKSITVGEGGKRIRISRFVNFVHLIL